VSDKLSSYRAKRRFDQTAEPRAALAAARRRDLRFVVQRHAARRLHYDLRLEWGGVLKSWAVTRGPSLDPADKRLAVETEDHPLAYAEFEGTIPKGQYGGGTVQVWDRGVWAPLSPGSVDDDLLAGKLKFVLAGERLRGGFTLVRMRGRRSGDDKRRNWLLIKEADSMARREGGARTLDAPNSVVSGRSLEQIAGGSFSFVAPQLCEPAETPPLGAGWVHELKLDGYRLQIQVRQGEATLRTRTGLDWTQRFPSIARAAGGLPDVVLDGEAVVLDAGGRTDFAALQAYLAGTSRIAPIGFLFDLLAEGGVDWRARPLLERKARLEEILAGRDPGRKGGEASGRTR
jgi:bifunctional non-homologous end joining protein LigD